MKTFKIVFISILVLGLIGIGIYREISYRNLVEAYNELKYNNIHKVDSLKREINFKELEINTLKSKIQNLDSKVDSLKKIKAKIQKDTFTVSTSVKGSAELLKKNLKWEN